MSDLAMFQGTMAPRASTPKAPAEKVDSQWYAAFGRIWLDLEETADEVRAVTMKHQRIDGRLNDVTLADQFPVGSPERVAGENRVIALGFERARLMKDFRRKALRVVRVWGDLPLNVREGVLEQAYAAIGESAAMEVAGKDEAVMRQEVWRRLVRAWNQGKDADPVNAAPCPF